MHISTAEGDLCVCFGRGFETCVGPYFLLRKGLRPRQLTIDFSTTEPHRYSSGIRTTKGDMGLELTSESPGASACPAEYALALVRSSTCARSALFAYPLECLSERLLTPNHACPMLLLFRSMLASLHCILLLLFAYQSCFSCVEALAWPLGEGCRTTRANRWDIAIAGGHRGTVSKVPSQGRAVPIARSTGMAASVPHGR